MFHTPDACPNAVCQALEGDINTLLLREWLITNGRGGFASGTVIGCPTRRYHGLLIAARKPPLQRFVMLSGMIDAVVVDGRRYELSTMELVDGFRNLGHKHLISFAYQLASPDPWVEWTYRTEQCDIHKRLTLCSDADAAVIRYDVSCNQDESHVRIEASPLLALRDFHNLSNGTEPDWAYESDERSFWVRDRSTPGLTLAMVSVGEIPVGDGCGEPVRFEPARDRVDDVRLRAETAQGYGDREPVQQAGLFFAQGRRRLAMEIAVCAFCTEPGEAESIVRASLDPPAPKALRNAIPVPIERRRLHEAADQFVVRRASNNSRDQATILAGYHWFGDWGRDSFIALEGLLLCSKRFAEAREVLSTFASAQRNGLIPNLFDDYGGQCHYNSVDASLWFIHAADRYLELSGDKQAWTDFLDKACAQIVEAFAEGTDFNIGLDASGLVACGHEHVQITWMDAKCGDTVFTPRHGHPVEVNALWYHALCVLAKRFKPSQRALADRCRDWADTAAESFQRVFWRPDGRGLYDCVRGDLANASVRPNQVFAVSLAHSPLTTDQQRTVFDVVTEKLLTPYGLRSLAVDDPAYRGRYGGTRFERDGAYHQGTVWSWLIGPYVEAFLRVHDFSADAKRHGRPLIEPLLAHLDTAGLGSVSEIFEGDWPHAPRGCIAQAWSVAELIRVLAMLD